MPNPPNQTATAPFPLPPHRLSEYNLPGWVAAVCALFMAGIAAWAIAAGPSDARLKQHSRQLEDHEQRIRFQENLTAQELSAINAKLDTLMDRRTN